MLIKNIKIQVISKRKKLCIIFSLLLFFLIVLYFFPLPFKTGGKEEPELGSKHISVSCNIKLNVIELKHSFYFTTKIFPPLYHILLLPLLPLWAELQSPLPGLLYSPVTMLHSCSCYRSVYSYAVARMISLKHIYYLTLQLLPTSIRVKAKIPKMIYKTQHNLFLPSLWPLLLLLTTHKPRWPPHCSHTCQDICFFLTQECFCSYIHQVPPLLPSGFT